VKASNLLLSLHSLATLLKVAVTHFDNPVILVNLVIMCVLLLVTLY